MPPVPVILERSNVNDETVLLTRWFVPSGASVLAGQPIAEIETSKATVEIESPATGYIQYSANEKDELPVGSELCVIVQESFPAGAAETAPGGPDGNKGESRLGDLPASIDWERAGHNKSTMTQSDESGVRFSRRAAELAKRHNLSAEMFGGRVLVREKDVLALIDGAALDDRNCKVKMAGNEPREPAPLPLEQAYTSRGLSARKRYEIRQIGMGTRNSLSSSVTVACPTRGLQRVFEKNAAAPGSLSAAVIFEVSRLLRSFPMFNAVYQSNKMCTFDRINIGFAIDDGRGLKVPVISDCDQLELAQVAAILRDLTVSYLTDKLKPLELAGATFTVSDLSAFGVSQFAPLISGNQSAILGISSDIFPPGSRSGAFNLTLVFDHQLADGRTAALFLTELRERLEAYENAIVGKPSEQFETLSCGKCLRSVKELAAINGMLLQSAAPGEYVCNLCILGH